MWPICHYCLFPVAGINANELVLGRGFPGNCPNLASVNILIATTGVLTPVAVSDICARLLGDDGRVTVMTVIEVPRTFLEGMDENERRSFLDAGNWETETAEMKALTYLEERGHRAVQPIVAAMRAIDVEPSITFVEGADPVDAIIKTAVDIEAELIVMGATRRLFTEQAWTSVSARVMERVHCPLVLVPAPRGDDTTETPVVDRQPRVNP